LETQASVAKGATSLYLANVISLIANALYFLVLTNVLGTLQVGIITALNLMIWFLVTVCLFAQPIVLQSPIPAPLAVLKFLPELLAKNDRGGAKKVLTTSLLSATLMGAGIAAVLFAFPSQIILLFGGNSISPDLIRLTAIEVLLLAAGQVCLGAIVGLKNTRAASVYIVVWNMLRYAFASILLVSHAVLGVLLGWIIGDAILLLLTLRKSLRGLSRAEEAATHFSIANLAGYSLYTLFAAVMGVAVSQLDKIITLGHKGLAQLAIYNVAIVASSFAGFASYALLTALLPTIASLFASSRTEEMRNVIRDCTRYVSIGVIPIAIGFAAVTEIPLLMFGQEYVTGLVPSMIVSVATGLTALGVVYADVLLSLGKLRWCTAANLLGLAGLLVVSTLLTPLLGLNGPALGRASLAAIVTLVYAFATMKSGFFELDLRAFLSATAGSGVMGVLVFSALSSVHSFYLKLAVLPVLIAVGALIYIGFLRLLRVVTISDIDLIRSFIPHKLRRLLPAIAMLLGLRYDLRER